MRLDLIDEFHLSLYPYVADEGTWLFDDVPRCLAPSSCSHKMASRWSGLPALTRPAIT